MAVLAQCSSTPPLKILMEPTPTNYQLLNELQKRSGAFTAEIVPTPAAELISALVAGRGDVVANLIVPPEREEPAVDLMPFLTGIREVVATGPAEKRLVSLEDLEGRSIHVARNGRHLASLERLNQQLAKINKPGCTIVAVDASLTDEELLKQVDAGKIPATLVDSHVADAARKGLKNISVNDEVAVSQDIVVAWATRRNSPELQTRIKAIIDAHPSR